ncbi:hypothetical protein B0H11DRAFT_2273882 [Mycena galericulata]|nr:hypothetical protein B0H11DRAFT_2273882 [Mycena galericulata]
MSKFTSKPATNFGVEVATRDAHGKPLYTNTGQLQKVKIQMTGKPQSPPYYQQKHPFEDLFKGMAIIPEERGLKSTSTTRPSAKISNVLLQPLIAAAAFSSTSRTS